MTLWTSFAIQALLAGSGVLAARMLGVEGRGNFAFLVLIPSILTQAGGLGLPTAATYFLATGDYDSRQVLERLRRPALALAAGWVPIQLLLILIFFQGDAPVAAGLSLAATPGIFAFLFGLAFLQGLRMFGRFNLVRIFPAIAYSGSMLAVFVVGDGSLGTVASVWAIGVTVTGLVALYVGVRALRLRGHSGRKRVSRRNLFSFGLRGLLGSTYPVDTFQLDQAVVGLFMSPSVLGVYVVAVAFTNLPRFVGQSIGIVAYPTVANSSNPREGRRRLKNFTLLTIGISLTIVAALEIAAGWLVPFFFGRDFEEAVPLVRILVLAASLTSVRRVLTEGARGRGEPGIGSIAELVAWLVLLPALVVFGAAWHAQGIAFAMVISSLAGLLAISIGIVASDKGARHTVAAGPPLQASGPHISVPEERG
jgi:O-antigen/teichoic acid export membrane protein